MDAKPAAYSNTDAAELNAVELVSSKLDNKRFKKDIAVRDKVPNTDGQIEIVDDERVPLGKIEVQVRKLKDKSKSYPCPKSLFAYAKIITTPVILFLADVEGDRVFWKHINPMLLQEADPTRDTITLKLATQDLLEEGNNYYDQWLSMIGDYQSRILNFPSLVNVRKQQEILDKTPKAKIVYYQKMIETLNRELSLNFNGIKQTFFGDIYQLAVGVHESPESTIGYSLYRVPHGDVTPSIFGVPHDPLGGKISHPQLVVSGVRTLSADGHDAAMGVIEDFVGKFIRRNRLYFLSERTVQELIFEFLGNYYRFFGFDSSAESYDVEDLRKRYSEKFIPMCARFVGRENPSVPVCLSLDQIIYESPTSPANHDRAQTFFISSEKFNIRNIIEGLDYLINLNVKNIKYQWVSGTEQRGPLMWSHCSKQEQIDQAIALLSVLPKEYEIFLAMNGVRIKDSILLNDDTILWSFECGEKNDWSRYPRLLLRHLSGAVATLGKIKYVPIGDGMWDDFFKSDGKRVVVDGKNFVCSYEVEGDATCLFQKSPLVNLIRSAFLSDLKKSYGFQLHGLSNHTNLFG